MGIRLFDLTSTERTHLFGLVKRLALLVDDGLSAHDYA
jgi:hypothetical protein